MLLRILLSYVQTVYFNPSPKP